MKRALKRRYGRARPAADRLPFHGGDCYACEQRATGLRDRRPEGGLLERACGKHKDPTIKTYDACMYCDGPIRRGSLDVDRDFAHKSCHGQENEKISRRRR
jgi:hypothetical protein